MLNTDATTKLIEYRQAEAERIARALGNVIIEHDADWRYFKLDDALYVEKGVMAGRTVHTSFEWESGRFEGFVS